MSFIRKFIQSGLRTLRSHALRRRWLPLACVLVLFALALMLPGCWPIPPKVLTTADNPVPVAKLFPSAMLAEPIRLRKGYSHTTQPFAIEGPGERWAVAIGFVRSDSALTSAQKMNGGSDTCWTDAPGEGMHSPMCKNATPGFHLQWELLRDDGAVVSRHTRDNLTQGAGGSYGARAITRTLRGFRDQPPGLYRLRISVLRDAKELDFLKPHILVDRPFFSARTSD